MVPTINLYPVGIPVASDQEIAPSNAIFVVCVKTESQFGTAVATCVMCKSSM